MNKDISVIVPYYNEAESILTTLELMARQSLQPLEVILVDSGSIDRSPEIIDDWIARNGGGHGKALFINLRADTGVPSSSKNAGIRVSKGELVAFMDCGLTFGMDWLEKQTDFMDFGGYEVVSGGCFLEGEGFWDRSAVAQTYGYKRFCPSVPSSLVRKSVFDRTGLFLEGKRSGYDVDWVNRLETLGIRRGINPDVVVQYNGVNYAESLKGLFLKSANYAEGSLGLHEYYFPYAYIVLFLAFWPLLLFKPFLALMLAAFYLMTRGYLVPILKSRGVRVILDYPLLLFALPISGVVIDSGKVLGILRSIFGHKRPKLRCQA